MSFIMLRYLHLAFMELKLSSISQQSIFMIHLEGKYTNIYFKQWSYKPISHKSIKSISGLYVRVISNQKS